MLHRAKIGSIVIIITGLFLLVSVMSCDTKKHHKVLSFFFDGVPPLDANAPQVKTAQKAGTTGKQAVKASTGSSHEPWRKCSGDCHGKRAKRSFDRQVYLNEKIPSLCYDCHTDYTTSSAFVHGPVVVGDCLFCHNPHSSKNKHLLKAPVPDLCFQCHEKGVVESIPGHMAKSAAKCNECHEAHASSVKTLLKVGLKDTNQLKNKKALNSAETTK